MPAAHWLLALAVAPRMVFSDEVHWGDCEKIATTKVDLQRAGKWCYDVHEIDVRAARQECNPPVSNRIHILRVDELVFTALCSGM